MDHSETSGKPLNERVEEIERRIVLFEDLFHAFSSRLDKHFEKYDKLIHSQQKQITELNNVIGILVNDQAHHAEHLRNKLTNSLNIHHGGSTTNTKAGKVTSLPSNSSSRTSISQLVVNPPTHETATNPTDDMFNDLIDENHRVDDSSIVLPLQKSVFDHKRRHDDSGENEPFKPASAIITDPKDLIDKPNVNPLGEVYKPAPGTFHHIASDEALNTTSDQLVILQGVTASSTGAPDFGPATKRAKYIPNRNEPFKFLKSPHSVLDVWKEYTSGIQGQPSIKEMETIYQATWRRDSATGKRYSRRKPLWKAIEIGLARGYTLEYIIDILENARYVDEAKKAKHPIGWLSQTTNIPDILK
ncbi:similar to Saccharomyces cerevisiae YOL116W MSN1 Transcriptional activator involved in regulation of invertase and glucoamylase expression [Maudiozyma barnettii]|uniref:Similar to Saccharomyces cerevisiae YOL116W MSN1 Transcriptional activator involved in regulation of invertase and glucoamylase expression n=1 Tax=Maudiozyma barnettii TaxID=61262 RepID=A0A8H2ZJA3_9SACH|nr:Msn1p [Kazachstania barnettii]CAB4256793.1 similar to Saccharomyces cerevisiae YOL116W MSN1 Transcriptional activator involved in regulation of invertase and glucoamylase expression [Kazachstania barnettii]CAD1785446.1 similar to Saccharomyces cerevisiae YOL116W MSN1 Transcriptional activator involved in regulation of invertase and glucoamylase expression [Kazachstania barnettii]